MKVKERTLKVLEGDRQELPKRKTKKKKVFKIKQDGKRLIAVACLAALPGCTSFSARQMFADTDQGFVMLAGDAEGIRAYNDGLNGLITNTKTDGNIKSSYWQSREKETNVKMFRFGARAKKGGGK